MTAARRLLLWLLWSPRRVTLAAVTAAVAGSLLMTSATAGTLNAYLDEQQDVTVKARQVAEQRRDPTVQTPADAARAWVDLWLSDTGDTADWASALSQRSTNLMTQYLLSVDRAVIVPARTVDARLLTGTDTTATVLVTLDDGSAVRLAMVKGSRGDWRADQLLAASGSDDVVHTDDDGHQHDVELGGVE